MQEKLKKIINSYPEFSRETVFNIVREFNKKTLEEKKNQSKEEILESFMVFGNNKIYFFEKTVRKCKMLIIEQKGNNILVKYREFWGEENTKWNFSKVLDNFEEQSKWDTIIDIELSEKIEKINLSLEIYSRFCIIKDFLEYFLFKNIMLFLSEESLVALDFVKALKEVEKYNVVMEMPNLLFQKKDFFQYGTMFSMLNEIAELTGKYKKLPMSFLMAAMFCNNTQDMEFIFDDIIKHKEAYLNINSILPFSLLNWRGFVMSFLKVNKITERWNVVLEKSFNKNETENKEKVDIIYDIFDIGMELEEKNFVRKLVNKNSFEAVKKMKEQLSKKLLMQKMKTVKNQKFEISKEFKELEKMLKKQFPSIEMINEERRLFFEGFEQKNCAYSYMEKIKDDKEIIFSLKVEKEDENNLKIPCGRYTIGIEKNGDFHFKVTDVLKKSNISDEDTKIVFEKISEIIKESNKKMIEEKAKKINCFAKNIRDFPSKEKIYKFLSTIKEKIDLYESKENILFFYFEKLIENIQENLKKIRKQNINLKDLEFSFEEFENEDRELFIENLISEPYRNYEATKNFNKIEEFEALNKDLAFLLNKELLEQAQNIPLENSGTVTEFLENFKNKKIKLLKIIKTEKEYVENCLILNVEPKIEKANKPENVISIWQVKDTKIKVMLESFLKNNKNEIAFNIKSREGINFELIPKFENGSRSFFLEKEAINNSEEENSIDFDIPEWFELYIERYCGSHIVVKNSRILSWVSQKFNNNIYEKFRNGNLRNKIFSFGNDNFFEFSYNENGITDIVYTNIGSAPFSLKKENPELLKKVQTFYKELMEEMNSNY